MPRQPQPPASHHDRGSFGLEIHPDGHMVALIFPLVGGFRPRVELNASQAEELRDLMSKAVVLLGGAPGKPFRPS